MKGPKHVEENLVNYQKAQQDADGGSGPVEVEIGCVIMAQIRRKDQAKSQNLGNDVSKKTFELALQAAGQHDRGNPCLNERMGDPQSVMENRSLVAHKR